MATYDFEAVYDAVAGARAQQVSHHLMRKAGQQRHKMMCGCGSQLIVLGTLGAIKLVGIVVASRPGKGRGIPA